MHFTYGASLKNLFAFADTVDTYGQEVISEIEKLSAKKFRKLLLSADDSPYSSPYLMSMGPMPSDRTEPERKVISQYVLEECCKRILKDDIKRLRRLHGVLRNDKSTAASAGMIFKYRAHQYLREGRILNLSPLHANTSPGGRNYIANDCEEQFTLPRMEEHLVDEETVRTCELGTYFRSRSANTPVVDSWTLIRRDSEGPPTLLAFHVSSDAEGHDIQPTSLAHVNKLVPVDAQRYLVIFTPKGVKPWVTMGAASQTKEFHIFHCQIDPVELFLQEGLLEGISRSKGSRREVSTGRLNGFRSSIASAIT